jgi:hypothetical protein
MLRRLVATVKHKRSLTPRSTLQHPKQELSTPSIISTRTEGLRSKMDFEPLVPLSESEPSAECKRRLCFSSSSPWSKLRNLLWYFKRYLILACTCLHTWPSLASVTYNTISTSSIIFNLFHSINLFYFMDPSCLMDSSCLMTLPNVGTAPNLLPNRICRQMFVIA